MELQTFIRLDTKGHWKGTKHVSSLQGQAGNCVCFEEHCICGANESWESGISCYEMRKSDLLSTFEDLLDYWIKIASLQDVEDYKDMQVTVFEGRMIGRGADGEDTAECVRTLAEVDAQPIMKILLDPYYDWTYCGEDDDEINFEKAINKVMEVILNENR